MAQELNCDIMEHNALPTPSDIHDPILSTPVPPTLPPMRGNRLDQATTRALGAADRVPVWILPRVGPAVEDL